MKQLNRMQALLVLLLIAVVSIGTAAAAEPSPRTAATPAARPTRSPRPTPPRSPGHAEDAVLTRSYNNERTGATLNETVLNTSNVNVSQFGKIFTRAVDGQLYAMPLFVPDLDIPGHGVHNVIFVATQKNKVYAFDADDPAASDPLWTADLGPYGVSAEQEFGTRYNGVYRDIMPYVGITSTPVIDLTTNTIYVVAFRKLASMQYEHRLYALDLLTGAEKNHVVIAGSVQGTADDNVGGVITFDSRQQLQRVSLLLHGGVVYLAFAGYADTDPYHGWVFGYAADTLAQRYIFCTTPDIDPPGQSQPDANDGEGGIWMSGQGIAVDETGDLYMVIGNGNYNAFMSDGRNYGNSIIRLHPLSDTLQVQTWFTPYNYVYLNNNDYDLGISGALPLPGTDLLVTGSKEGKIYVVDQNDMGGLGSGNDNQIVQSFLGTNALGDHIHGSLVYWNTPSGPHIYVWSEQDRARTFAFDPLASQFNTTATSVGSTQLPNGMPGGILSISANNSTPGTGIVWATHPIGDANNATKPGVVRAYNAEDLAQELWNSTQNSTRDDLGNFAKFNPPLVADGRVYIGSFSASTTPLSDKLVVYGLLAPRIIRQPADQTVTGGTTATLTVVATGAGPLSYQWYAGASGDTASPITGATSSTLTTAAITQTTQLWVRVTNSSSVADSQTATVTPYYAPTIVTGPQDQTVPTGTSATLSVTVSGSGPFSYQWYRGSSGDTSNPIPASNSSTLTTGPITSVTRFWVHVSDGINQASSQAATVTPYSAPTIISQPRDQVVPLGATATLTITVSGTGPFSYQWYAGEAGDTSMPLNGATASTFVTPAITETQRFWVQVDDGTTTSDSRTAVVMPEHSLYLPLLRTNASSSRRRR